MASNKDKIFWLGIKKIEDFKRNTWKYTSNGKKVDFNQLFFTFYRGFLLIFLLNLSIFYLTLMTYIFVRIFLSKYLVLLILLICIHFVFFFCKGKPSGWDSSGQPEGCIHTLRFNVKNQLNDIDCRTERAFNKVTHGLCEIEEVNCQWEELSKKKLLRNKPSYQRWNYCVRLGSRNIVNFV